MFTLAILGRPNVGKSTLFNRLTGARTALTHDTPGITRDRREGAGNIGGLEFNVLDTAGLEDAPEGSLAQRMSAQSETALGTADAALLVVDGRIGLTPEDRHFAARIRKSGKPVVVLVNKCEGGKGRDTLAEAERLGFGPPVPFSAEHGEGMGELYDALAPLIEPPSPAQASPSLPSPPRGEGRVRGHDEEQDSDSPPDIMIAIVGRPNAGKSTLFNRLLGFERTLTGPEAGITRDAIAVEMDYAKHAIKLVDTAGIRRKKSAGGKVEAMAVGDSLKAVQYAQVVILVLDAEFALEKQDLTLAGLIEKEGRALVVALNKWDKVADKQKYLEDFHELLESVMPQVAGVSVQPISAERGTHVEKLMDAVFTAYAAWHKRIPTARLNDWLEQAVSRHSPPIVNGRRIKLRYMTQIKTRPPTFALFASKGEKLPDSYQRYLVNSLRKIFDMPGVPIRIELKKNKNPYV